MEVSLSTTRSFEIPLQPALPLREQQAADSLPQKRKLTATDFEIPDSEGEDDEDYGWAGEDERDMPPMPPQWQGSEDILIPPPAELHAEEEQEDEPENVDGNLNVNDVVDDSEDELA